LSIPISFCFSRFLSYPSPISLPSLGMPPAAEFCIAPHQQGHARYGCMS
jgi:hypothetical protein